MDHRLQKRLHSLTLLRGNRLYPATNLNTYYDERKGKRAEYYDDIADSYGGDSRLTYSNTLFPFLFV